MNTKLETAARAAAEARRAVCTYEMPEWLDDGAPFAGAYAFQDAYVAAVGEPVGGYKLAVNGAAQMTFFGVGEPVSARIFAGEMYGKEAVLYKSRFGEIMIEPELAAVMGPAVETLSGPVDREAALSVVESLRPAIEVIDQRGIPMPQVDLAKAVAFNVFNAGIVLGEGGIAPEALQLAELEVLLEIDGARVAEAQGTAPQHPGDGIAWLIGHLSSRGLRLQPGMVVMCGTHLPPMVVDPEVRQVEVAMSGLGRVGFAVGD